MVDLRNVVMGSGQLGNAAGAALVTVAEGDKFIIREILLANNTVSPVQASVTVNGVVIVPDVLIHGNDTRHFALATVVDANGGEVTINGHASVADAVHFYISGVEVEELDD